MQLQIQQYRGLRPTTLKLVQECVGKGWHGILDRLVVDLEALGWDGTILQVKEKFGGLRFYVAATSDVIYDRISTAEHESYQVCEECGAPGTARHTGWIKTLCNDCHLEREAKKQ